MTTFREVLKAYKRIGITGAPRTGKTTLTQSVSDRPVIHTDDWKDWPWPDVPDLVRAACDEAGASFVVEGVQVPRTLRKGLELDALVYLSEPQTDQTPAQVAMGKGVHSVLAEWLAMHPDVTLIRGEDLEALTQDEADVPSVTRRYLTFTLDASGAEPTPQGGRRFRAKATKAGVFQYARAGRIIREYRPAAELRKPQALSSLKGSPVVVLHPASTEVNTANERKLRVGHFEDPSWDEENQAVVGFVVINDGPTLDQIEQWGGADISCGYDCRRPWVPGFTPDRQPYDTEQLDYIYNHVAIGPPGWGRQGMDVGLTLDHQDNQLPPGEEENEEMPKGLTNDSELLPPSGGPAPVAPAVVTPPAATEPTATALTPEELAGLRALLKSVPEIMRLINAGATGDNDKPPVGEPPKTTDTDTSEKKEEPPKTTDTDTDPPKKTMDAADVERIAQESAEVRAEAMRLLGETYSTKDKTTRQVQVEVVKTLDSAFNDQGRSDDAIAGAYGMAVLALTERAKQRSQAEQALGNARRSGSPLTTDSGHQVTYEKLGDHIYKDPFAQN